MQFHGIGGEEHSSHTHQVTTCMHDHSHSKTGGGAKAASAARAQSQQAAQVQGEGHLSLSAWLDRYLSGGKKLLRNIWGSSEVSPAGETGTQSGQEQVLAQIGDSRGTEGGGTAATEQESRQADSAQALHGAGIERAASAVEPPRIQEVYGAGSAREEDGQEENFWRKIRVRFKDIAGHLTGHLKGNAFQAGTKSSLPEKKVPVREVRKPTKTRKDAVEIDSYRVEESYLLDSYDRKGGYSKLSTKK